MPSYAGRAAGAAPRSLFNRLAVAVCSAATLAGCVVAPVQPRHAPRAPAGNVPPPAAAPMYFYPERGQPAALQDRDRYECYRWAVRQTGTDPGMTPVRDVPPAPYRRPGPPPGADVVAGAATGAVIGAAVSGPRHAGGNMVIGAIFGAMMGAAAGDARNRAIEQDERRREDYAARANAPTENFRRAVAACMQGRGYAVQ